ncbi:hypothetical protein HMPREF9539_01497 [Escherichia coli MS 110-3]|nr:hypothetical protein HMPREF9539_01497 [Escherichia coli MS 110-3]
MVPPNSLTTALAVIPPFSLSDTLSERLNIAIAYIILCFGYQQKYHKIHHH